MGNVERKDLSQLEEDAQYIRQRFLKAVVKAQSSEETSKNIKLLIVGREVEIYQKAYKGSTNYFEIEYVSDITRWAMWFGKAIVGRRYFKDVVEEDMDKNADSFAAKNSARVRSLLYSRHKMFSEKEWQEMQPVIDMLFPTDHDMIHQQPSGYHKNQ